MSSVKAVADSITTRGHRLTTLEVCMPTAHVHRLIAYRSLTVSLVPEETNLERLINTTESAGYTPHLSGGPAHAANKLVQWGHAKSAALSAASLMIGVCPSLGVAVLSPYSMSKLVVTSAEWSYLLRDMDQDNELGTIARCVESALQKSKPKLIQDGIWHLPFIFPADAISPTESTAIISAARCSRCSQLSIDGRRSTSTDRGEGEALWREKRYDCFEHQATPSNPTFSSSMRHIGWVTYRESQSTEGTT